MNLDTARAGFLSAILQQPDDDTARLVFADWLEEHGDREDDRQRAEFIRLQIEIAKRWGSYVPSGVMRKAENLLQRIRKGSPVKLKAKSQATLLARVHLLLHGSLSKPDRSLQPPVTNAVRWFMNNLSVTQLFGPNYHRGFVDEIHCQTEFLLADRGDWGSSVFAVTPLTTIVTTHLRVEIDPPDSIEGHGWQAYYYHPNDTEDAYSSMNGWETREQMVRGVIEDVRHLEAEFP